VGPSTQEVRLDGAPSFRPGREDLHHAVQARQRGDHDEGPRGAQDRPVADRRALLPRLSRSAASTSHTTGLLLLTNDGEFAYRLTHPRFGVEKTYIAKLQSVPRPAELNVLRRGVAIDGKMTTPAQINFIEKKAGKAWVMMRIAEGRYHQVRKMFDASATGDQAAARRDRAGGALRRRAGGVAIPHVEGSAGDERLYGPQGGGSRRPEASRRRASPPEAVRDSRRPRETESDPAVDQRGGAQKGDQKEKAAAMARTPSARALVNRSPPGSGGETPRKRNPPRSPRDHSRSGSRPAETFPPYPVTRRTILSDITFDSIRR